MANTKNTHIQSVTVKQTIPDNSAGTGTIATVGVFVVGSGTSFLSELEPGGWIVDLSQDEMHRIVQVMDDTSALIDAAFTVDITAGTALDKIPNKYVKEISTSCPDPYEVDGVSCPANTFLTWTKSSNRSTGGNDWVDPIIIDPLLSTVIAITLKY